MTQLLNTIDSWDQIHITVEETVKVTYITDMVTLLQEDIEVFDVNGSNKVIQLGRGPTIHGPTSHRKLLTIIGGQPRCFSLA